MAVNSRPELQVDFIHILTAFKKLSPAIHERLINPKKMFGSVGLPTGTGAKNEFGYAMNVSEPSNTIKNLKEWYMVVNVLLADNGYAAYVIDEVKPMLDRFRLAVRPHLDQVRRFVDKRIPTLRSAGVLLDERTFYVSYALYIMMDNFPTLEICQYERLKTLALNKTKDRCNYNIEDLRSSVSNYTSILTKPSRGVNETVASMKAASMPTYAAYKPTNSVKNLTRRLAALDAKKGGKRTTKRQRRRHTTKRKV